MASVRLLFLGTGTSAGIPMIGCECAVCTSKDPRDQRMRASVVISYYDQRVLIDTTPEIRLQCVSNQIKCVDAVVMTHAHADHIMGMDDLRRFNSIRKGPLDVWSDERTSSTVQRCFGYAFNKPDPDARVFRPHLIDRRITGPFEIGGATWTPIPLLHAKLPILGFRVGNLAYCTDVSHVPDSSYDLLRGLDVLVLDALAWHEHPSHLSVAQALEVVDRVKPQRTFFTHIAHGLAHEETNRKLPSHAQLAYDGQVVEASL